MTQSWQDHLARVFGPAIALCAIALVLLITLVPAQAQTVHVADVTPLPVPTELIALRERPVAPGEVGKPLAALATGLGVRLYRLGECHGFWEAEAKALQAGDTLVEIVPRDEPTGDRPTREA